MTLNTTNSHGIVVPEELGDLVIAAAARASVAMRASTVVTSASRDYRVPVITALPASSFVAEGAELAAGDPTVEELTITPAKCGHVAPLSRELVRDSFGEGAPEIVAAAQGIDIAKRIDLNFFGGDNAVANDGLLVLADVQEVAAGELVNLDPFAQAQSMSENVGSTITSFVASPTNALLLAQLKRSLESKEPLLQAGLPDPTAPITRQILGSALLVSPAVGDDVIWAIPQAHSLVVVREDVETVVSTDVYFTSDRVAVKTTMRVGWSWPHPGAVVKINVIEGS
jgi:HK97 family phage major capsid protein